jgi:hypothetical protein
MRRLQKLCFTALLALIMALHATGVLVEVSPGELSWLSMAGVGISALIAVGAIALFVRILARPSDGLPFLDGSRESRTWAIWRGIGGVVLCLIATFLAILLMRLTGLSSSRLDQYIDIVSAVVYPLGGAIAFFGLLGSARPQGVEEAAPRR